MKKLLLIGCVALASIFTQVQAQETEIYYPDLRYATEARGFTVHNVTVNPAVASEFWKRSLSGLPDVSELGYTRTGDQTVISAKGYDGSNYYITESYAVINAVDLSTYSSIDDLKVTFFTKAQYGKVNFADFSVVITTAFTGDVTTTTWTDVTNQLDQIDDHVDYDGNWTKSTLDLNDYKGESAVVLAFKYTIDADGDVDASLDRPGMWKVCEVRFTATAKALTNLMTSQFDDWSKFEFIHVTSTNAQEWVRKDALRTDLVEPVGEDYKSIQVSAVYDADGVKNVSPVEAWTVFSPVDFTGYAKGYFSFWNMSQYKKGGDSDLTIKMSTDYVRNDGDKIGAVSSATWTDITSLFFLDESLNYDSKWKYSVGEIAIDAANPNVTFALVYTCTDTYADVNGVNADLRAGTWKISDVQAGVEPLPTAIAPVEKLNPVLFYPNPATDVVNFSSDVKDVKIYNINGQQLNIDYNVGGSINVSAYPAGIYLLAMKLSSGAVQSVKLIKK
ncbi:T9SS type A sorting domain-containing protein [Labilibacter sediminis]|nr:T9SS type A sorting domain-containing protein [Labilibacter sediminis]